MNRTMHSPVPEYTSPACCASVCAVLAIISGPARPDAVLRVEAVSRGGFGREQYQVPCGPREFVDEPVLKVLEDAGDWAAYVNLAAEERGASREPVRLGALMVRETLPLSEDAQHRQALPVDAIAATIARYRAHVLAPSAIIVGGARTQGAGVVVAALWALDTPFELRSDADQSEAMTLMRRLAFAFAADGMGPDVPLTDLSLPLPGTSNRELPPHHQLFVDCLVSDRRYAIEDLATLTQES